MILFASSVAFCYFMPIFRSNVKRNYKQSKTKSLFLFFNLRRLVNSLTFVFGLDRILENRDTASFFILPV